MLKKLFGLDKDKEKEKTVETKKTEPIQVDPRKLQQDREKNETATRFKEAAEKSSGLTKPTTKKEETNQSVTVVVSTSEAAIAEEAAALYASGEDKRVVEMLSKYINEKQGKVERRLWYMLMDIHQNKNNQSAFEKAAILFSSIFNCSPPSWVTPQEEKNKNVVIGRNILMLEGVLDKDTVAGFKDLIKASREEKFCRIDVSRLKIDKTEIAMLHALLNLMYDLKKFRVKSVLMGDMHIINFCKKYINPNIDDNTLNPAFVQNEELFWLLNLEVLQWKGRADEYDELAFEYAVKFELSPPGWDDQGVMSIEASNSSNEEEETPQFKLERNIDNNNVDKFFSYLDEEIKTSSRVEVDFMNVEKLDFSIAGAITHKAQQILEEFPDRRIVFKNPNELIIVILEMVAATEFLDIETRKR